MAWFMTGPSRKPSNNSISSSLNQKARKLDRIANRLQPALSLGEIGPFIGAGIFSHHFEILEQPRDRRAASPTKTFLFGSSGNPCRQGIWPCLYTIALLLYLKETVTIR
jgi:hypothetical protein